MRVVVMASGEGTNLQALLDAERGGVLGGEIVAVLSDRPGARALDRARAAGKAAVLLRPAAPGDPRDRRAWDRAILRELARWRPDLVVLAGFMRLLGPEVVAAYRNRIMNVHPSLLPAFPGRHAVRQALAYGVRITGCTVHFVDEGVDTGPIILQAAVPVYETDDEATLTRRIQREEHRIYPVAVWLFARGRLAVEGRRVRVRGPVPERLAATGAG